MLRILISSGSVEMDDIILGNTYESVTSSDDYEPVQVRNLAFSEDLLVNSLPDRLSVTVPFVGGKLSVFDLNGWKLYYSKALEHENQIPLNLLGGQHTVLVIKYELNNIVYTKKTIV